MPAAFHNSSKHMRLIVVAAFTVLVFLILGYHPYAEDGGIYLTALLQRLHPDLYPYSHAFAGERLPHSAYLWIMEVLCHKLPVMGLLLALQWISLFLTLDALWKIAEHCFNTLQQQLFSFATAAIGLSLPVAGTALYIVDPYVTARSISTPLLLYGLLAVLKNKPLRAIALVTLALFLHPLMALWGGFLLLACCLAQRIPSAKSLPLFSIAVWLTFCILHILSPHENTLAQTLAHSRSYWYLSQWEWYEWIGLIVPPALLAWLNCHPCTNKSQSILAHVVIAIFILASFVSLTLAANHSSRLLIARMQPLRMLHLAYIIFLILLGGRIGEMAERKRLYLYVMGGALGIASCSLFSMQRTLYASSQHIEWPFVEPINPWEKAFLWIRRNTPEDAFFAMDAHYISLPGEDAQSFRALAQRSSLPDYSKDGGVASVFVSLASEWKAGENAQENLNNASDAERITKLKPTGATWIILPESTTTNFNCPYMNMAVKVKVCKLPNSDE